MKAIKDEGLGVFMGKGIIEGLDFFGQGILREHGKCLFLKNGLPGENVEYQITVSKRNYAKGTVLKIAEESPHRVTPPCPHFGRCGGCSFQHCDEETELTAKENHVKNVLYRIGGLQDFNMLPLDRQRPMYHYRNKVTWHMRHGQTGFFIKGSKDWIPIDHCMLLAKPLSIATDDINKIGLRHSKTIMLRTNEKGELFAVINGGTCQDATKLSTQCSLIKGVATAENIDGKMPLITLGKYCYEVTPGSFFQINFTEMEALITFVKEHMLLPKKDGILLDLYCGVGTLGITFSKYFQEIWGIESYSEAVPVAQRNAANNGVCGHYIAAKTEDSLETLIHRIPTPHTVVVDPPRSGLAPSAAKTLSQCGAQQIIYISCDPATLSRDLKILKDNYKINLVKPFNLFPRTSHLETVVLLQKNDPMNRNKINYMG